MEGWCITRFPRTEEGQKARDEWEYMLDMPLEGEDVRSVRDEDLQADADSFMKALSGR